MVYAGAAFAWLLGTKGVERKLSEVEDLALKACGPDTVSGRYFTLPRRLKDDYKVSSVVLGHGLSGDVMLARSRHLGQHVAVKTFCLPTSSCFGGGAPSDKVDMLRREFANEVQISLVMDHPHVARVLGVYEARHQIHMVIEHLGGGTLLDHVREHQAATRRAFSEPEAAGIAHQMLLAVNYMHSRGIVHRDLKPNNFVYVGCRAGSTWKRGQLKLIDFGLSGRWRAGTTLQAAVGTPGYVAPEVMERQYTSQCDLWSFGVIVFRLLLGHLPFECRTDEEEHRRMREGNFLVRKESWLALSESARDLIVKLLKPDPAVRLTAEQALNHPWIVTRGGSSKAPVKSPRSPAVSAVVPALRAHRTRPCLERACRLLAARSTAAAASDWGITGTAAFKAIDLNDDGHIQLGELQKALWEEGQVPQEESAAIFEALDLCSRGEIKYSEFVAALVPQEVLECDRCMEGMLRALQVDKKNLVSVDKLRTTLGALLAGAEGEVDQVLAGTKIAACGHLSCKELVELLSPKTKHAPICCA